MTDEFLLGKLVSNPQALERFNLAPTTTAKPVDEGLQKRLAERAAFIASLDEDKGLKARLAERAAYVAEISKPAPAARKRFAWQNSRRSPNPRRSRSTSSACSRIRAGPATSGANPTARPRMPKLFSRSVSPRDGWDVKITTAVRSQFHRFTDDVERATYLTGHRSGRTVYVTGMIGDYAGTRNQVKLKPSDAASFNRQNKHLQVVGLFHTHPSTRDPVEPSMTDLRNWCSAAGTDAPYVGVIVAPGMEETVDHSRWAALDHGIYLAHPDGRVEHARGSFFESERSAA